MNKKLIDQLQKELHLSTKEIRERIIAAYSEQ